MIRRIVFKKKKKIEKTETLLRVQIFIVFATRLRVVQSLPNFTKIIFTRELIDPGGLFIKFVYLNNK